MTLNAVNHVLPHTLAQTGGSITGQTAAHRYLTGMASTRSLEAGSSLRPVTAGAGGRSSWPKGDTPHETAPLTAQPETSHRCTQLRSRGAALLQAPYKACVAQHSCHQLPGEAGVMEHASSRGVDNAERRDYLHKGCAGNDLSCHNSVASHSNLPCLLSHLAS